MTLHACARASHEVEVPAAHTELFRSAFVLTYLWVGVLWANEW
jgi:hypothetical protein